MNNISPATQELLDQLKEIKAKEAKMTGIRRATFERDEAEIAASSEVVIESSVTVTTVTTEIVTTTSPTKWRMLSEEDESGTMVRDQ